MYFGQAILEDAKASYPDTVTLYEFNLKDTINNIKRSIKKAILSFIDKVDKFLDKCKDSKLKSWCKGILAKARKLLTKTDKITTQEEAKKVSDELNECNEEFKEKKFEYDKFEPEKFEYDKFEYEKFGEEKDKKKEDKSESKDKSDESKSETESEEKKSKDWREQKYHKAYEEIKKLLSVTPYGKLLNNIVPDDNEEKFVENIKDWRSCESFYNFTKNQIIEEKGTQFQQIQLKQATWRFITEHIKTTPHDNNYYNVYGYSDHGYVGDDFNPETMVIKGTKTDGKVKRVLLFGIRDLVNNEKIKHKMLVEVE